MKDLENIDDLFSRSLENFEVPPPIDAKRAIEQELQKKGNKKNRKGGWLLLAIVSMSVLATAMFVQNNQSIKTRNDNRVVLETNKKADRTISSSENTQNADALINNSSILSARNESKNNSNSDVQHFNLASRTDDSAPAKQVIKITNSAKDLKLSTIVLDNTHTFEPIFKSTSADEIKLSQESINLPNSNSIINTDVSKNDVKHDVELNQVQQVVTQNQNNAMENNTSIASNDSTIDAMPENNGPGKIVEPRQKSRSYFGALNFGMGYNSNHFGKGNSISTEELKDSIIFNKPYYNVQLLGGMQLNNFAISTGIGLYKQTEKVQYSYINQKMERILVDSIYIDPITLDTIVKHNVPVDTLMNNYQSNTSQTIYTTLQIPLIISYEIIIGQRLTLGLSAGGAVNILLQSKGNYKVSAVGTINDFDSKTKAPLQTISFNAMTSVGLNYNLNGRTSLQLALPFQIGLSNVYKKEYFINKNVNSAGLQVGLKYDF